MVWCLPPGRAGRAPQASRHSNRGEVALGASGPEVIGASGPAVTPAPVAEPAFGEQALTIDAKPTLPANRSS